MDSVLNFIDIFIPACSTAAAVVALLRGRADVPFTRLSHHGGPMRPGVAGLRVILCITQSNN